MQKDLDANFPELNIQLLGMNQITHETGNATTTNGRDLPWLQDVDANKDGRSDVWLSSWAYEYRDVVIVDANNQFVQAYNLTTNDLADANNYADLRQLLVAAASTPMNGTTDTCSVRPGSVIDLMVLKNDLPSDGTVITSVTQAAQGQVELLSIEQPEDLDPFERVIAPLVISEVRPGEFIELFNTSFQAVSLDNVQQQLVSLDASQSVSQLAVGKSVAARGYVRLDWPAAFAATTDAGELVLYRDGAGGFQNAAKIDDFLTWGDIGSGGHKALAESFGKWSGDAAPSLAAGSIHRIPGTAGNSATSYNTQAPGSPGAALDNEVTRMQVLRYTAPNGFTGNDPFQYTVRNASGNSDTVSVAMNVAGDARPLHNTQNALDTSNDGIVTLRDALLVINALNRGFRGPIPGTLTAPITSHPLLDSNGNNSLEPQDALLVINFLNRQAEGEAAKRPPLENDLAAAWFVAESTASQWSDVAGSTAGLQGSKNIRNQKPRANTPKF